MTDKPEKSNKLKARLPRGLADRGPAEIAATRAMIEKIRAVYELYGALGKFLPDQDRPNEGVFSFQDDDEQWLSLRYDLTAPLARYVAENFDALPKPYRSYRVGNVFRNEKPGPGRFRQFMQFDADTVGSASPAADTEMCMMAADVMRELGIPHGNYIVRVNNRKLLDGIMDGAEIPEHKRLTVLRALDKFDRLGVEGVRALLGKERRDESGDITRGADLDIRQIDDLMMLFEASPQTDEAFEKLETWEQKDSAFIYVENNRAVGGLVREISSDRRPGGSPINNHQTIEHLRSWFPQIGKTKEALDELEQIATSLRSAKYGSKRIRIDPSVVRGLEYYTGPVFEVELTFTTDGKDGSPRFGSVGGGGRYDGLVSRFRGEPVPATGFSIGVSRLLAALEYIGKVESKSETGPVVVTVFDKDRIADYQAMVSSLRNAGIRAELYLGAGKFGPQMKYADKRNAPCVVIQGSDEKAKGEVTIKDLIVGAELAKLEKGRDEYLQKQAEAQSAVKEANLVEAVHEVLARHGLAPR
ncbi:MAG: histidine--tRNA ligase [Xanthobacteraceae bacterium]